MSTLPAYRPTIIVPSEGDLDYEIHGEGYAYIFEDVAGAIYGDTDLVTSSANHTVQDRVIDLLKQTYGEDLHVRVEGAVGLRPRRTAYSIMGSGDFYFDSEAGMFNVYTYSGEQALREVKVAVGLLGKRIAHARKVIAGEAI